MNVIINCLEFDENPTDPNGTDYFLTSMSGGGLEISNSANEESIVLPLSIGLFLAWQANHFRGNRNYY